MSRLVCVGQVAGAYGVRGWVKVRSHTQPVENILRYTPWSLGDGAGSAEFRVLEGRLHGNAVVVRVDGVVDRDQAALLQGELVYVPRECFPKLPEGKFYWFDLVGLDVLTRDGVALGKVTGMLETGANDVMEVQGERERLIPFIPGVYVDEVCLDQGCIRVEWDPDF